MPCRSVIQTGGMRAAIGLRTLVAVALLPIGALFCSIAGAGDDWPQFRGPMGQGISDSTGLPQVWSETKNIVWKTPIPGRGWSSPVVCGRQIWLTTAIDDGHSLRAICVDRDSGRVEHDVEVFHVEKPIAVHSTNTHASPTPVIEPGRLYVHFGSMGTACLATDTAKILWTDQSLQVDHMNGPGSSPILVGDLLIVNCDGTDLQYVAALDKRTGKLVWKTDRTGKQADAPDRRKAYCTPLAVKIDGAEQLISPAANQVVAYDPPTGRELWKVRYDGYSNVARPVFGHGLLFVSTGFDKPQMWAIRPGRSGDVTATNVVWRATRGAPCKPSPVFADGALYMLSDQGMVTCLDAGTGHQRWQHRLDGPCSASPISTDGRIYFCGESGATTVIRPGPEYQELAVNPLDGRIMASPAVVGRAIILRTDTHLYRIEEPDPKARPTAR